MTDYLTRLAKRTLGLLPVAQPLITPSFSSFTSRRNDHPEISFNDNIARFDQQVIHGTQEKEVTQAFSKPRSKVQKTALSHELSFEQPENFVAGNADNSLLPHKKIGSDNQDQRHPETKFISHDARLIPHVVHIENQVASNDIGTGTEEKYEEQESVPFSGQIPKRLENSWHQRNLEMIRPQIEKEIMGSRIDKEITGSMTEKEMKDIDIPDPISVSRSLTYPFSEKYGEGHLLPVLTSDFKTESNLNKKPNPDSSGHNLKPDYPGTSDNLHEPGKLISSDPSPRRVAWPGQKDRDIRNQEHNEIYNKINKKTGFKNVIYPVIKISPEGKDQIIREIQTKLQQPTIKVTIGRVEVRAVPAPPVFSPSPSMKKPSLSLDEYLKQHNG